VEIHRATAPYTTRYYARIYASFSSLRASWPQLKDLFIRLNTPLPASAAVERLFSTAGLVMSIAGNDLKSFDFNRDFKSESKL
jgi:hypothetical protein